MQHCDKSTYISCSTVVKVSNFPVIPLPLGLNDKSFFQLSFIPLLWVKFVNAHMEKLGGGSTIGSDVIMTLLKVTFVILGNFLP